MNPNTLSVGALLVKTEQRFRQKNIPDPQIDAKWLLASICHCKPVDLILDRERLLTTEEQQLFETQVARRLKREPLQYILGETEFWGLPFKVSRAVLVPRHETELLVEQAIKLLPETGPVHKILDIGTGSGCIAIALAHQLPQTKITATDIAPESIALAKENARINGVADRIEFIETNIYPERNAEPFDLIAVNPPYVSEKIWNNLQEEVRYFEPKEAIVAGPTGLEIIERILDESWHYLKPACPLIMEIGDDQRESVINLVKKYPAWEDCVFNQDYHKIDRLVTIQRTTL